MQSVAVLRTRFGRTLRRACGPKVKSRPDRMLVRLATTPCKTASPTEAKGSRKPITLGGQHKSDDGARQVFGDGMHGRLRCVNQGDLPKERPRLAAIRRDNHRKGRSQSVHSSKEAG